MATGALTSGLHQGRALAVDLDPRPPGLKNEGRHDQGRAQHDGDEDTPKRHGPLLVNHPEPRAVSAESASNARKPRRRWLAHLGQTRGVPSSGAERLRCLAGGSVRFIRSFATLETQSLEKPNVTHLQRLAKSRVRVHTFRFKYRRDTTSRARGRAPLMAGFQHDPFPGGDIEKVQDFPSVRT